MGFDAILEGRFGAERGGEDVDGDTTGRG